MSAKGEIAWSRRTATGERRQVYARPVGGGWRFYVRARRFEPWQPLPEPELEDWLTLLEAAERRVQRRLLHPEDTARLRRLIRERFPEAEV